jgi:GTP-binding protein
MFKPTVAIVGRPNVGKSALFNKLIGKRLAIVEDTPGVTRDRIYGSCQWRGVTFSLVDTGGIEIELNDEIIIQVRMQADVAIISADVIILVVDVKCGVVSTDLEIAQILKKSGKPVVLCVNKCDKVGGPHSEIYDFYDLGLGDPIEVSSVHGHGTGDLLDAVVDRFERVLDSTVVGDDNASVVNVAVIGRPNVGKSSLVNSVAKQNRCIVSDVAGTTRDSIDTVISNAHGTYNFIDTAGIRRKSRIKQAVERYSVMRAQAAIERSDVSVVMLDATENFTEQDTRIAGFSHEAFKGCVLVVNKWDAVEKDDKSVYKYQKKLSENLAFMPYAPVIFVSAKSGQRVGEIFKLINNVYSSYITRISTGALNDFLAQSIIRTPPPTDKGKRLKIYYMTQVAVKPPTFVFFVNKAALFHFSYKRYLENRIRQTFGFKGTPIKFIIREKQE